MKTKPLPKLDPTKGYITSLTLENIRCFGSPAETLSLTVPGSETQPARWTVILGANGVGKTTVLRALAMYRETTWATFIDLWTFFRRGNEKVGKLSLVDSRNEKFDISRSFDGENLNYNWSGPKNWRDSKEYVTPFIGAYGAGRAWRGSREKVDGAVDTLFDRDAHVRDPSQSLADWTSYQLFNVEEDLNIVEFLKDALIKILPDVTAVELDFDREKRPFAKFQTPDGWIALDDMSWGYQVFAAFAADYASRLIEWYPDSKTPLAEPGICLVDELDLHMHPSWQRKVIDDLSRIFPATQFIVTVHSPLVVQAAEDANLVVLKRYPDDPSRVLIDNDVEAIKGWRIDQVLTSDLFGLDSSRPPSVAKAMDERADLLAKNAPTPEEQARLDALEDQMMGLPTETQWEDQARALVLRAAERLKSGA
jgi:AAA domain, putative AbiEii toxin, Type IV TA system